MDELDISGKRYISSKRAAKENRYHVDYIGQLIRAGKIVGTKVGRAWYIEAESLANYLGQEHVPPTNKIVAENYQARVVATPVPAPVAVPHIAQPAPVRPYFQEHRAVEEKKIEPPAPPIGGLRYFSDDEPEAFPLSRENKIEIKRQTPPPVQPTLSRAATRVERKPAQQIQARDVYSPMKRKVLMYAIGTVGVIAFIGAAGISYYLHSDTTVEAARVQTSVHF